ncbi:MAG TPA: general secretion pathway protein GspB [Methylomirabilota bacterium]|nr:general secretion pathway protein GspB [Methylomirabilota bacterium]
MSYILDALKKAAEQRGANATVLLRPSTPLPRGGRLYLPWVLVGVLLLLNLAGVVYLMWPAPSVQTPLSPVPPAKVGLIQPVEAPPPPSPTQVIPAEPPPAPAPRTPARVTPATPPASAVKPPAAPATAAAPVTAAPAKPAPDKPAAAPAKPAADKPAAAETPTTVDKVVGNKAIVRITPEPRGTVRPAPPEPKPAAAAPTKADGQRFKLEVLSYSDVPAQRLVFINGRRYREGDTIEGGAVRVEAIREDNVLLNEDGQRFTLR